MSSQARRKAARTVSLFLLSLSVSFGACGEDGEQPFLAGPPLPPGAVAIGGEHRLVLNQESGAIVLERRGVPLVSLPLQGWQLGCVSVVEEQYNYDPFPLYRPNGVYQPLAGLHWVTPRAFSIRDRTANALLLELEYPQGERASLVIRLAATGRFEAHWRPVGDSIAYFRLRIPVSGAEAFYGLGEYYDDVNHRGKLRAMQIELDPEIESRYNEAHVPIPLLLSTAGWGVFVESDFPAVFDVAHTDPAVVETTWGTGVASREGLRVHWLLAEHTLDLTRHYYEVTGAFRLPPPWVYGPLVWRNENRDQEQLEADLRAMRRLDLAASGVWIDRPYATAVNSFDFDPEKFPEPERMFRLAQALGYRMALWHSPYLDRSHPATAALRAEARAENFFPPRFGLLLNDWGEPIDFTNPEAVRWWQRLLQSYVQLGVHGFKLDYGEDVVTGVSARRNRWQFFDGSDDRTMHSRYQWFYHSAYAGVLPAEGGLLLVRHAVFGDQRHGVVVWPGDLDANFARHRERVETDGSAYVAVGGLPAAFVAGLNLASSGFPLYGSDTGGYRHGPPDKELFTRWFQQTALSTVMQIGTGTSDVAWEPTPANGFDAEMLDWYRDYTRLHLRLFPYIWTYLHALTSNGRPVLRPFGLAYPELGAHPWDQYFVGDDLLVAPVVERGARERAVLFPPGRWLDWWDGTAYVGPATQRVPAPLPRLPLFVREGAVIPLLRPTIDTLSPAEDSAAVDSLAGNPGVLYSRIVPGTSSGFALFDGTYLAQSTTRRTNGQLTIELEYRPGAWFRSGAVFEIFGFSRDAHIVAAHGKAPFPAFSSTAALEAAARGFTNSQSMWIKLAPGDSKVRVEIKLSASSGEGASR